MRRSLKWLLILGILGAGAAGVAIPAAAWWHQRSQPKYLTAKVSRGRIESAVNSTGTVKPVRTVSVGASTSGPIEKVLVDFNSVVEEGQLLAQIDQKLPKAAKARDLAAIKTQKADLARVDALLKQAEKNEARARKLLGVNKDYLSETEMDQFISTTLSLKAQYVLAEANIDQAVANLENSEANFQYTKIRAPLSFVDGEEDAAILKTRKPRKGRIIERKVDRGQTVAASFQTPELFTIALEMDEHMYIYASVDEADVGSIKGAKKQGRPVKFTVDAYPGELFEGKIQDIRLNSTTTQNVVTYPVIIDAPNRDEKLMPGMTANITFQIEAKESALRVPAAALRFIPLPAQAHPDDRHYLAAITRAPEGDTVKQSADEKATLIQNRRRRIVWVQEGEWLRGVPLTLGLVEHQHAEVLTGELTEGQAVVTGVEGFTPK